MEPFEVDAIATRVAELLSAERPEPEALIDASEAARRLGVSRGTIYARANELGAVRLGAGPKARLRFEPRRIREAVLESRASSAPGDQPVSVRRPRRRRKRRQGAELLPIRGHVPQ